MASLQEANASKHSTCASVKRAKGYRYNCPRRLDETRHASPKYSERIHELPGRWAQMGMFLRDLAKLSQEQKLEAEEKISMLIKDSFMLLLHPDLKKVTKTVFFYHMKQQIAICQDVFRNVNELLVSQCSAIVDLLNNDPWGSSNSILRRLIQGEHCEEKAVCEFLKAERHVLKLRIHLLCEDTAPDLAKRLAAVVWRYHLVPNGPLTDYKDEEIQYMADLYIVLLVKLNRHNEVFSEMKELTLPQGLHFIQRLRAFQQNPPESCKVWKKSRKAAEMVVQYFAIKAMRESCDSLVDPISYDIMLEWVDIFSSSQEFLEMIEKIFSQAASPPHIFTLCRALTAKSVDRSRHKCIVMYIKGLTMEMNHLEQLRAADDPEAIRVLEEELSQGFLQLADLLSNRINDSRECVLTAFSLNPTASCLDRVTEMAKLSGKIKTEVIDTGQPLNLKMCDNRITDTPHNADLTPLPRSLCDDLTAVLHCPRFRALSWQLEWPDLKERCENYVKERERGESRVVKELKYLNIDYDKWKHLPLKEDENHDGIEKGYELELETGSLHERYEDDEFTPDFSTSPSETGSDTSFTMKKSKRTDSLDPKRKKARPQRTTKRGCVSSDDSRGKCHVENTPGKKLKCQRKPKGKTPKSDSKRNGKSSVVQLQVSSGRNISSSDGIIRSTQKNNNNNSNYSNLTVPEDLRNIFNTREPRNPNSLHLLRNFRKQTPSASRVEPQDKSDFASLDVFSKRNASCLPYKCVPGLNSLEMMVPAPQQATVQVVQVQAHGNQSSQSAASGTAGTDNGTAPESVNGRASGSDPQQAANLVTPKLSGNSGGTSTSGRPGVAVQAIRRESPALTQVQRRTAEASQSWVNAPASYAQNVGAKAASSQATASGAALPQFSQAFGFGRSESRSAGSTLKQALLTDKPKLAATSAAGFGSQAQPAGLGAPPHPPAQTSPPTSTPAPLSTIPSSSSQSLSQPPSQPPLPAAQPGFGTPTQQQQPGFGTPAQSVLQVGFTTPTTAPTAQVLVKTAGTLTAPGLILASATTQGLGTITTTTTPATTTGTPTPVSTVFAVSTTSSLLVTTAQTTSNITVGTPSTISTPLVVLKTKSSAPATGPVSRHPLPALVQRTTFSATCEDPPTQLALVPTSSVPMSAALVPVKRTRVKGTSTTAQIVLSKLPSPASAPIGTPVGRPVGLSIATPAPGAAAAAAAAAEAEAAAEAAGAPSNVSRPLRQPTPAVNSNSLEAEILEFEAVLQQVTQGKQSSTSSQLAERPPQPLPEDDVKPTAPPTTPTARAVQTDSVVEATLLPIAPPTPKPLPIAPAPVTVSSSFTQTMPPAQSASPQTSVSPGTTPCSSLVGTPVKKKPRPKIVTSPAAATTPSDRGTVKTPSTPIGANANCNKLNQKTTEDEHTTARILSILRQYDEQLRCSPEINNKPAPRRRNQIQPGASPGKRKKNKGKSNMPELSPSTDDTHTMGSEDSSIASHFADGILEATPTSPLSTGDDRSLASTVTTSGEATPSSAAVTSFAGVTRSASIGPTPVSKVPTPPRPPSVPAPSSSVAVSTPSRTPTPQPALELAAGNRVLVETAKPQQVSQIVHTPPPLQISAPNVQVDSSRTSTLTRLSSSSSHLARALQTPQATQTPLLAKALETPSPLPQLIQTLPRVMLSHQPLDAQVTQVQQVTPVQAQEPPQVTKVTQLRVTQAQAPQQLVRVSQATQVQSAGVLVPQATQTVQHIRLTPGVHASQQTQQVPQLIQTSKSLIASPAQTHQLTRIVQVSQPAAEPTPQLVQISTPQLQSTPVPQLAQVSSPQLRPPESEEPATSSPPKNMVYMVPVSSSSQLPVVVSSAAGMIQVGQLGTLGALGNNMQHAVVVRQIPKHTDGKAPGEVTRDTFLLNVSSRTSQPVFISSIQQLLSASQAVTAMPPLSAATPAATVAQSPTVVTTTSPVFTVANAMESAAVADSTASSDSSTTGAVAAPMSSPAPLSCPADVSAATPTLTPSSTPSNTPTPAQSPVTPTTPVRNTSSNVLSPVSSPTNTMTSPVTTNPSPVYSAGVPARPPTLLGLQKLQHQQIQHMQLAQHLQQVRMKQQQYQEEEDKQIELQKNKQLRRLIQQQQQQQQPPPPQQLSQPAQPAPLSVPPVVPKEEQPSPVQTPPQPVQFKTINPTHLKQLLEQAPQPLPLLQPTIRFQGSSPKISTQAISKYELPSKARSAHSKQLLMQDVEKVGDSAVEKSFAKDMTVQANVLVKEEPLENLVQDKGISVNLSSESISIPQTADSQFSSNTLPGKVSTLKPQLSLKPPMHQSNPEKQAVQELTALNAKKRAPKSAVQKYPPKIPPIKDASSPKHLIQKQSQPKISSVKQCAPTEQSTNDKSTKEPVKSPMEVSVRTTVAIHVTVPQPPILSKFAFVESSSLKGISSVTTDIPTFSLSQNAQLESLTDSQGHTLSQLPELPVMPPTPPMVLEQKPSPLLQALEALPQEEQISSCVIEPPSSPIFGSSSEARAAVRAKQRSRQRTSSRQSLSMKSEVSQDQVIQSELVDSVAFPSSVQQGSSLQQFIPIVQNCPSKKSHRKKPDPKAKVDPDPVVAQHITDTIMRVSMGADCSSNPAFNQNIVKESYYEGQENIPVEVAVAALCGDIEDAEGLIKGNLDGDLKKGGEITLLPADPSDNTDEFNFSPFKNNLKKIPDDDEDVKKDIPDLDQSCSVHTSLSDAPQAHTSLTSTVLETCIKDDPYAGQETPFMKLLKRKTSSYTGSLSERSRSLSGSEDSSMDKPSTSDIFPEEELSLTLSPSFLEFAQMSPSNSQDAVSSASPEPPDKKKKCPVLKSYLSKVQLTSVSESFSASIPKSELEVEESVRVKTESDVNSDVSSITNLNQLNGGSNNAVDDSGLSSQVLSHGPVMEMFFESTSVCSSTSQSSSLGRALLTSLPPETIQFSQSPQFKQEPDQTDCAPEISSSAPENHDAELPSRSDVNVDEEPWGKEPLYSLCDQTSDTEEDFWEKSLTSDIIDVDHSSGMGEVLNAASSEGCASKVVRASARSSSRRSSTPQRKREAVKRKDISADNSCKKQPVDKKKRLGSGAHSNDDEEGLVKCGSVLRSAATKAVSSARKDVKDEAASAVTRRVSSRTHKPVTKFDEAQKKSKATNRPLKGVAQKKK